MNVLKCIRRGVQSGACDQILQPQLKSRRVVDSSGLLVLQGSRGIALTLASSCGCSSRGKVGKKSGTIRRLEAVCNSFSSIRYASNDSGVARIQATEGQARRLIMYSKPGCCLCDGLKEKLSTLPKLELEIRNILTNPVWENTYQYEIPVLAYIREDGIEEAIPRLSPRLSAEQMQKKLEAIIG